MTNLELVISEIEKLPPAEQSQFVERVLEELHSEQRWSESYQSSGFENLWKGRCFIEQGKQILGQLHSRSFLPRNVFTPDGSPSSTPSLFPELSARYYLF